MPGIGVGVSPAFLRVGGSFTPADLGAGLLNWYDETSWTKSGIDITGWTDLSGNGRDLAPSGGVEENATGGPNGEPCIECNGTDGYLRDTYTQTGRERIYAVCRPNSVLTGAKYFFDGASFASRTIYSGSSSLLTITAGALLSTSGAHTSWQLIDADFNGATSSIQRDNATPVNGSSGSLPSSGGLTIGAAGSIGAFAATRIVELVITDGSETDDAVRDYLNNKWGIF